MEYLILFCERRGAIPSIALEIASIQRTLFLFCIVLELKKDYGTGGIRNKIVFYIYSDRLIDKVYITLVCLLQAGIWLVFPPSQLWKVMETFGIFEKFILQIIYRLSTVCIAVFWFASVLMARGVCFVYSH